MNGRVNEQTEWEKYELKMNKSRNICCKPLSRRRTWMKNKERNIGKRFDILTYSNFKFNILFQIFTFYLL